MHYIGDEFLEEHDENTINILVSINKDDRPFVIYKLDSLYEDYQSRYQSLNQLLFTKAWVKLE